MRWELENGPVFTLLSVELSPGESIVAEPGAYVMHRGSINVKTSTRGGVLSAFARRLAGGESIFMNEITAGPGGALVKLAPSTPGDITYIKLDGSMPVFVQDRSFLAMHGDTRLGVAWRGFKGLIAEGELMWLKAEGVGGVWVNSFGAIQEVELGPGEELTVDNGHMVAIEGTVQWRVRKLGGLKTLFFGGEGLVMELKGPGRAYIQTRTLPGFAGVLLPFLRSG